jgi:hypothetical protein
MVGKPWTEEQKAAAALRRQDKQLSGQEKAMESEPNTVTVIYRPGSGDPHTVKWNGITFKANVPIALFRNKPEHYIEQLLPKQFPGLHGEINTKHAPTQVFMGEMAKNNPFFEVDGVKAKRVIAHGAVPPAGAEWAGTHEAEISKSDEIDESVAA